MTVFKNAYTPSKSNSKIDCSKSKTYTEQSHKDECDINNILAKYQRTGIIEHRNEHSENYAFCTGEDFQTAMETIATANSMFEDLPSSIRNKFENQPAKFLDYVQDPANKESLYDLGLAVRPIEPPISTPSSGTTEKPIEEPTSAPTTPSETA